MKIKEHGKWTVCAPTEKLRVAKGWPAGTICARRAGNGGSAIDWYDYQKEFKGDTVLATLYQQDGQFLIATASDDPSKIFPGNATLIEIEGWDGKNLEELYNTPYDPKTKKLLAKPVREQGMGMREMAKEIDELKTMVAALLKKK